ncbi:ABC transporter permease [Xylanimonas ulmi]|uniref:Carbohydrate ABC transporter membrane protein 1 (CUT1 family) n=1 Tax=Xylanimonas ulmi TaxID=228973 RepID=A0A4Q7M0V9_9MICO|nr:ABC transporter permease subunit [Xylanibacterium ulmi]RZS61014.1 carbohydrate ABC transporter membrane protein 1 (CUT1 family) [Xylanibacterium ulmi]
MAVAEVGTETVGGSGPPRADPARRRRAPLTARIRRDGVLLAMILPGFVYFAVFQWLPLAGNVIAFLDYQPYLGITDSAWVGLRNFAEVFADPTFYHAVRNTLVITVLQLVLFFPVPILLALLLNSVMTPRLRTFVQSVVYLPHFIGWVLLVSIFTQILGPMGVVTHLLDAVGVSGFSATTTPEFFPFLIVLELIWKDAGWGTIIFLAALANVSGELQEAAVIDGAGKWRRIWHVSLPAIMPVIILLLILQIGTILSVGFEQIILQRDAVGPAAAEVLDTWVYYHGIQDGAWGPAAAVGLVKGIVGFGLVLGANKLAHLFGQDGIYRR